jgi:type VI protein secretion system component Hcp
MSVKQLFVLGFGGMLLVTGVIAPAYVSRDAAHAQHGDDGGAAALTPHLATSPCTGKSVVLLIPNEHGGSTSATTAGPQYLTVDALSFGASRSVTGASVGKLAVSAINVRFAWGSPTLALYSDALTGRTLPGATLDYITSNSNGPVQVCRAIALTDATVTSFQESVQSRGPGATDSVTLDFKLIKVTDFGHPPNSASVTWDVAKNSSS